MYASTEELARILKIRSPSAEQTAAMTLDLETATIEIDSEIDLAADATALTAEQTLICDGVALDRAKDLWYHRESATAMTGLLGEDGSVISPGRYSWERYAQRLAPLKNQWGLA